MKTSIALLLVGLCALAFAGPAPVNVNQSGRQHRVADRVFLERQQNVLRLLRHVFQPNSYEDQAAIAQSYNIEQHLELYGNRQAVQELIRLVQQGMLPRGEVFSIFYENQLVQAVALTQVLLSATNYETFYNTACWARQHVNEGMFVYALSVAVLHRQDTQGIVLPPIYEIYPHYFVNGEVIQQAREHRLRHAVNNNNQNLVNGTNLENVFYVQANYSGWYLNADPQQRELAYFTEDVGLNAYYYYFNLDYPSWMGGEESGLNRDRRGELFYYVYQQLLARYQLERLSNGYGSIPLFNWEGPIRTGCQSTLRHPNGLQLASRPAWASLVHNPHNQAYTVTGEDNQLRIQEIEDYERRIRDAIDSGIVIAEDGQRINIYENNGLDVLGRIIDANPDSPNTRYYGYLQVIARQVLGYSAHPVNDYMINSGVLEHLETSLRDPLFFQFYQRIVFYFLRYQDNLPNYTRQQLNLDGVRIENVHVDRLVTFFDNFDFDISNALYVSEQEFQHQDNIQVLARQIRLNNRPYSYTVNVQSDRALDVVVRVFLGPRSDEQGNEIPLEVNRVNFIELDQFVHSLQSGQNAIVRNSRQGQTVRDRTSYRALYQQVMAAINGQEEFHLDMSEAHNGWPTRFLLPRGTAAGQVYQLYVYIGPQVPVQQQQQRSYDNVISAGVGSGARYLDNLPLGYPLNRAIDNVHDFLVPNSHIQDVTIYHSSERDLNSARV